MSAHQIDRRSIIDGVVPSAAGPLPVKLRFVMLVAVLLAGLSGCGFDEQKQAAEALANRMFEELSNGLTDAYFDLYSDQFYAQHNKEEWRSERQRIHAITGEYRSHELVGWNAMSTLKSGSIVLLVFRVSYENGDATEALGIDTSDGAQIDGHLITPGE